MSVLKVMSVSDAELAARRLQIVTNLLEKAKQEKGALGEQMMLLKHSNNELSEYALKFKLDENVEKANTEAAKEEAVVADFDLSALDELSVAEDFANNTPENTIIDVE